MGSPGWVRSSAWIWLFSSIESTIAWSGRVDVEADHVPDLVREGRIARQLELSEAVRSEAVSPPDLLYRGNGARDRLGHRPAGPMGGLVRRRLERQGDDPRDGVAIHRRLSRRPGLVAQQPMDAFLHEALLPAPHAGLGLAGLTHDGVGAEPVAGQQHDAGAPDMLLGRGSVPDDRFKPLTIRRTDGDGDSCAHDADSHTPTNMGIPIGTLPFRSIH